MKKTKIICTIGPATDSKNKLKKMIEAGMDVARINLSHADHTFAERIIKLIRELNVELDTNVAILVDIKGPKMRIINVKQDHVKLNKGDIITLTSTQSVEEDNKFVVNYPGLVREINKENKILLSDGEIELIVIAEKQDNIICEVLNEGIIRKNASVNVPGVNLTVDYLSVADKNDIIFATKMNADFISLSFVRNANDVLDVNDMLIGLKNEHIQIIAKIENHSAVEDIDNIIKVSNGIMIARGDLGVEIELEKVPSVQKNIVEKCFNVGKICIVATQMLCSMQQKSRPTRAEVSDVANAVIDGVDAVLLSEETAIGNYPIESIEMATKILVNIEENLNYNDILHKKSFAETEDITTIIAHNVVNSANKLRVKAIVVSTISGYTARMVSSFRPYCPIIVTTPNEAVARSLTLNWGVISVITKMLNSTDEIVKISTVIARKELNLKKDDIVIISGGFPISDDQNTNFMKIEKL